MRTESFQLCYVEIFQAYVGAKHSSTISTRFGFSSAAATLSLSFSCLLTAQKVDQERKRMPFHNSYIFIKLKSACHQGKRQNTNNWKEKKGMLLIIQELLCVHNSCFKNVCSVIKLKRRSKQGNWPWLFWLAGGYLIKESESMRSSYSILRHQNNSFRIHKTWIRSYGSYFFNKERIF
jgi:hypothetical protein